MPDVTFRSARFSNTPAPDAINEMLGRDLADWLRAAFVDAGYEASDVIAEDYGYGFWLTVDGAMYWVTHTQVEPPDGDLAPLWLVGVHDRGGCALTAWRHARPRPEFTRRINEIVHAQLTADPSITDINWWAVDMGRGPTSPTPPAGA